MFSDRPRYAEYILATVGLVAYYRLDEPTRGVVRLNDLARARRNGQATGTLDRLGGSAVRGGDSIRTLPGAYAQIANNAVFSPATTGEMTWSLWTRPANTTSSHVIAKGSASGNWEYTIMRGLSPIFADGAAFTIQLWQSNGNSYAVCNTGVDSAPNDLWVHVAATTVNGTAVRIYLNGVEKGSTTSFSGTMAAGTSLTNIGRRPDNTRPYTGRVGDVAIWSRALTANEVFALYYEGIR